ncbi:hypothetical protein FRC07_007954 [Ceratobasidium sp. 392]|nr:hypothetical protein FRC07_007954 [Ceratobasidium sp. 392]
MDEHATSLDHMDIIPSLTVEGGFDPQMLSEDHRLHTPEVLDALDQVSKQIEAETNLINGTVAALAQDIEHRHIPPGSLASEPMLGDNPEAEHIQSIAAMTNGQDYIAFDRPGSADIHTEENQYPNPILNEHDIPRIVKDLAHEIGAEMDTDPSAEPSIADPDTRAEQTFDTPVVEDEHPAAQPLRRMDDETIPVTAHHKDSIIETLDNAPPVAAAEAIQLKDVGEQATEDEIMSFEQPKEVPADDTAPSDTSAEPPQSNTIYLEHIQVIEPDDPIEEDDDTVINAEALSQIQTVGDNITVEGDHSTLEIEGLLVPPAMEIEPTSAVSTEFAIENDPALALTETATTTTSEEASIPTEPVPQSNSEPQPEPEVPTEAGIAVTTTTTVTTVLESETEAAADPAEQPGLGANADADADDDQAEYMRRAEQTLLEQSNMDVAGDAQEKGSDQANERTPANAANIAGEPIGEPTPDSDEPTLDDQLKQGQVVTAGPIDPAVPVDPIVNPPDAGLSPHAPQYAIALDAPSTAAAAPGLFNQPKSPEWQGFAALDADAPGSPEFPDHSSEIIEGPQNDPEADDANTSQPVPSTGVARSRKPKMIMEVVIPIPSKGKKALKAESPEPSTRSRSKSRAGSIASGNNVKFAPPVETGKKRKAESELEDEDQQGSDADAEGDVEEGYEDVEEDEEPQPVSKPGPSKPIKRPRRSMTARKTPTKVPEVLVDSRRHKKRRTRR